MDTRNLETLLAVARGGSLASAAATLDISATAVTQRLRALEKELGCQLVARSGRVVRPTAAGTAVLEQADNFLAEYRKLRAAVTSKTIAGSLRIGAVSTAMSGLLPDILLSLSKTNPDFRIFLEPGSSADLHGRVLAGHLDAAVIVRPHFELPKAWTFLTWQREPLTLLVPPDEMRSNIGAILGDHPYIRYDHRQWGGRLSQIWLSRAGIHPDVRYELDALEAIAVLVGRGLGVSIVPEWTGPRPAGISTRHVGLPGPPVFREIGLLWPGASSRLGLIETLSEAASAIKTNSGD